MATSTPTLVIAAFLFLTLSFEFPAGSVADSSPECPYPCLPPPTSVTNCPPPPPSEPNPSYPPPPPQPYTPGYTPPPTPPTPSGPGNLPYYYPPPSFDYPAPPPPNRIMPYFPYYYRSAPNSAPLLKARFGLPVALWHLLLVGFFLS